MSGIRLASGIRPTCLCRCPPLPCPIGQRGPWQRRLRCGGLLQRSRYRWLGGTVDTPGTHYTAGVFRDECQVALLAAGWWRQHHLESRQQHHFVVGLQLEGPTLEARVEVIDTWDGGEQLSVKSWVIYLGFGEFFAVQGADDKLGPTQRHHLK